MDDIVIQPGVVIPAHEVWFTTSRSTGAGGQHVNTTNSRVTLWWAPANSGALTPFQKARVLRRLATRISQDGTLQINVDSERSQFQNRDIAVERLAQLLRQALHVERPRVATRPSRGSIERRITDKKQTGEKKAMRKPVDPT
jgi:ribosome-associated protein